MPPDNKARNSCAGNITVLAGRTAFGPEDIKRESVQMAKEKGPRGQPVQPEKMDKDGPYPMMCKEGKGVRNFACPHYDDCLDKAAKGMWAGFTCRECCSYVQKEEESQG